MSRTNKKIKFAQPDWKAEINNLIIIETKDDQRISAPIWLLTKCNWFANLLIIPDGIIQSDHSIKLDSDYNVIVTFLDLLNNQEWEIDSDKIKPLLELMNYLHEIDNMKLVIHNIAICDIVELQLYEEYHAYLSMYQFARLSEYLVLDKMISITEKGYLNNVSPEDKKHLEKYMTSANCTNINVYTLAFIIQHYTNWKFNFTRRDDYLKKFIIKIGHGNDDRVITFLKLCSIDDKGFTEFMELYNKNRVD